MRTCHECDANLDEIDLHGQRVDKCPKCFGIFFDEGELDKIIHLIELYQGMKLEEGDIDSVPEEEHRRVVRCPEHDEPMVPMDVAGLTIDKCPVCEGIWLDNGEITALKIAENHIRQNLRLYIRLGE